MRKQPTGHIPSLDGLRAISILLVIIAHTNSKLPFHGNWWKLLKPIFTNSGMGVLTFFVISGYLITFLLRREWEKSGGINLRAFYLRRILRIFPAFYTYIGAIAVCCAAGFISIPIGTFVSAGTFTVNYASLFLNNLGGMDFRYLGHFWTLSLEEQFYLFWPAALLLCGMYRAKRIAVFIIVACPVLRMASYFLFPSQRGQLGMMFHTAIDPIMVGSLLALIEGTPRVEAFVERIKNSYIPVIAILFAYILSPIISNKFHGAYYLSLERPLDSFSVAIILLWVTRYPDTALGKLLNSRPLVFIGILSYSLYLWQQPFTIAPNTTILARFPLNIAVSFLLAIVSHYLIEKPFLKLKDRFHQRASVPVSSDTKPVDPSLAL